MRGQSYRTPEFRLGFAEYIHEREGGPAIGSKALAAYNRPRARKIIRGLMEDIESGRTPRPTSLPENNIKFLKRFLDSSPSTVDSLRSLRQEPPHQILGNAMDARRMTKWVREFVATTAPAPQVREANTDQAWPGEVLSGNLF